MKIVKEPAPIICEGCGKVFKTKYAFYCPKCIKRMCSERAKRIGLSKLGVKARWGKEERSNNDNT